VTDVGAASPKSFNFDVARVAVLPPVDSTVSRMLDHFLRLRMQISTFLRDYNHPEVAEPSRGRDLREQSSVGEEKEHEKFPVKMT
jgi:hypothetical protein